MHLLRQFCNIRLAIAFKQRGNFVQQLMILFPRDLSRARCAAFADMVHQAGTFAAGDHSADIVFALTHRKVLANGFN